MYRQASDDVADTVKAYFESFRARDEEMKSLIGEKLNGKVWTEEDYKKWRLNQIGRGKRFEALRDQLAERMTRANEVAISYVNDATPSIYSLNRNYSAYTIERVAGDVGLTLWDESTVRRLIIEQPDLMPYYPKARAIKRGIDLAWGKRQITSVVTSGLMRGLGLKGLVEDLMQRIPTMNRASAIRSARTAVTGAQNGGRVDSYKAAEKMGVQLQKEWMSTLDGRTRHSHRRLDGELVDNDAKFSNGCRYPGDPKGKPAEVYNCRCTLVARVKGVDASDAKRWARNPDTGRPMKIENMTYAQWAGGKIEEFAPKKRSDVYNSILSVLRENKVEYKPIEMLQSTLDEDEIIRKISGGDMTEGSCSSLALAYIGNKCGGDVTDFRGGTSQKVFSKNSVIGKLVGLDGVNGRITKVKKELAGTAEVLKNLQVGKEYYLAAGKHATIVRRSKSGFEYLELQSATKSGWHKLTTDTLQRRFGCRKTEDKIKIGGSSVTFEKDVVLMDVDSFAGNEEFYEILGYINTDANKQRKGVSGGVK